MAIATGSMTPNINIGDVVFVQKVNPADIKLHDIIEYKSKTDNISIVHRVIEIEKKQGGLYFITKGDNNISNDANPVFQDQVVGKVIYRMPVIGYPAVWLNLSK